MTARANSDKTKYDTYLVPTPRRDVIQGQFYCGEHEHILPGHRQKLPSVGCAASVTITSKLSNAMGDETSGILPQYDKFRNSYHPQWTLCPRTEPQLTRTLPEDRNTTKR